MLAVNRCVLPDDALLGSYSKAGSYTDCYTTDVPGAVSLPDFTVAFYTTRLFKLERAILKLAVSKPSTDKQARQLALGEIDTFSAWNVECKDENQILLSDFRGRTRSWLMVESQPGRSQPATRLFFGSAVVPMRNRKTGDSSLGMSFHALLAAHRIYSVALLYSAKKKLERMGHRSGIGG